MTPGGRARDVIAFLEAVGGRTLQPWQRDLLARLAEAEPTPTTPTAAGGGYARRHASLSGTGRAGRSAMLETRAGPALFPRTGRG